MQQTDIHFWSYPAQFFLEWEMFQTKVVQKIKRHIVCWIILGGGGGNPAVYEIMLEKFVEPDRPQMTIWRVRIACWIPKATDTHTQNLLYLFLSHCDSTSILLYIYVACTVSDSGSWNPGPNSAEQDTIIAVSISIYLEEWQNNHLSFWKYSGQSVYHLQ
jgi:hypothetical protein